MILPMYLLFVRLYRPEFFYSKARRDYQRDVMAFVLALNGFAELASVTRQSERHQFYWSTADALTEHCLANADEQFLRRGIKALVDLIGYADMAPSSQLLIHYNIARLAVCIPDRALVQEHIGLARKGKYKVIEKRIALDPELAGLDPTVS